MQKSIKKIVLSGVIAALYAVLTLAFAPISFGNLGIEFRISEALCVLSVFNPYATLGLFCGCLISNLIGMSFSTLGIIDVIFGSLATLIAGIFSYYFRKITIKGFPLISFLMPVLSNALIVGLELHLVLSDVFPSFIYAFLIIGIGEAVVIYTLGTSLFYTVKKTKFLSKFFES
ncbi:MAG: QueT transporter family protein [Clostridia bacterium]|nr:QueT transporter family protein [Clostridia bacterium]